MPEKVVPRTSQRYVYELNFYYIYMSGTGRMYLRYRRMTTAWSPQDALGHFVAWLLNTEVFREWNGDKLRDEIRSSVSRVSLAPEPQKEAHEQIRLPLAQVRR